MSSFDEGSAGGHYNPDVADNEWKLPMQEKYPTLVGALRENIKKAGDAVDRPNLTLMIFAREGRLKFSLSSQDWPRTYYGVVTDPSDPIASIERALKANEGEWSARKAKNDRRDAF